MKPLSARARVRAGAALLDKEEPGWADKINLSTFDITDTMHCVLGQVYNDRTTRYEPSGFAVGYDLHELGEYDRRFEMDRTTLLGFDANQNAEEDFPLLERWWRVEIKKRQSTQPALPS